MKWAVVEDARKVCGSVRVGRKNPKSVWWNEEAKAVARRKETLWKCTEKRKEKLKDA